MARRKLKAIGYGKEFIDFEDDAAYRQFFCDIEQRFLHKKNDDWVRTITAKDNEDWQELLNSYCSECGFAPSASRAACADNLLNLVVDKLFGEKPELASLTAADYAKQLEPQRSDATNSSDIAEAATKLCTTLGITPHPDPAVSLEAACIYINKYLNEEYIKQHEAVAKQGEDTKTLDIKSFPVGLPDFKDGIVNIAARILRLLNIEAIRDTQTAVNETLIAIQNITAENSK